MGSDVTRAQRKNEWRDSGQQPLVNMKTFNIQNYYISDNGGSAKDAKQFSDRPNSQ